MNEFRKCSVVMLQTDDKKAIIHKSSNSSSIGTKGDFHEGRYIKQHLYVCSDDEINMNDWIYCDSGHTKPFIEKVVTDSSLSIARGEESVILSKKIIATTDKSLNLPELPERFLKEFCDKGGIWEIQVEYICDEFNENSDIFMNCPFASNGCKTCESKYPELTNNTINVKPIKQTLTREEIVSLCLKMSYDSAEHIRQGNKTCDVTFCVNWIKQNL